MGNGKVLNTSDCFRYLMTDFGVTPTRALSEKEEEICQSVMDTFKHSEIRHLKDIFEGRTKKLTRYYGEDASMAGKERGLAEALVREHAEPIEDLLYELDNSAVKKNEFEKNLVDEGISGELVDEIKPTKTRLMVFAYHLLYNDDDFVAKLRLLKLNSRLFKETTERTYKYDRGQFNLDNFEREINRYVRRRNDELHRPFTIRYNENDETIFLDFYKETARVKQNIFKQRKSDHGTNDEQPRVTHETGYKIRTLLCRVDKSSDEEVKFVFKTDPQSGWTREMERFFEEVAGLENPFDEENQEVDEGASEVLDAALERVPEDDEDDDVTIEDVEQSVTETMQELADASPNEDLPEISDEDIKWVGLVVEDDEDTMIASDDFTAKTDLHNYVKNTPGASDRLFHILNEAEKENLGLRFRSELGDGKSEEFIIRSKFWSEDSRVDEEARNILNSILKGDGDDD